MRMLLGRDRTGVQHFHDWETDGHLHLSYEYSSVISHPWLGRVVWFAVDSGSIVLLGGDYSATVRARKKSWGTPLPNMKLYWQASLALAPAEKVAERRIRDIERKGSWEGPRLFLVLDNAETMSTDGVDRMSTLMRVGPDLGISVVTAVDEAVERVRHEAPVNTLQLGYTARGPYAVERAPNQGSAVLTTSQGARRSFVFDHDVQAASVLR